MPIERTAASSASRGETVTASNFDAGARACVSCARMWYDDNKLGTHDSQRLDDGGRDIPDQRVVPSADGGGKHCLAYSEPLAVDDGAGEKSSLGPVGG